MAEQVTEASTSPQKRVRLRPETEAKLGAITDEKRWTDTEAIDAMCDEFMDKRLLSVTDAAAPTTQQQESGQPAVDSLQTDQSPSQTGEDMTSEDDADHSVPPASTSQKDANPDETLAESA